MVLVCLQQVNNQHTPLLVGFSNFEPEPSTKNMKKLTQIGLFALMMVAAATAWAQNVTTASIAGKVMGKGGESLQGAGVVAVLWRCR